MKHEPGCIVRPEVIELANKFDSEIKKNLLLEELKSLCKVETENQILSYNQILAKEINLIYCGSDILK